METTSLKKSSNSKNDMLNGPLAGKIFRFALPLAATTILQQLFNSADVAVVGRFVGSDALAAVGANGSIINLFITLFVGLSIGTNVVIANLLGQGNETDTSKAVHTSVLVAIICGVFLAISGPVISRPILSLMGTPEEIMAQASLYLLIYFLGMPFVMLYNFISAVFRSNGNTKLPLACLFLAGIVNVVLNLIFVIVCHMGVEGVAIATVISNVISSMLLVFFLSKEKGPLKLEFKRLKIDIPILKKIAIIGIPAGLQGTVFSFSNVLIQSAINSLGTAAVAASAAALNYEIYSYYITNAFGQAAISFAGQNYGAGKIDRCRKTVRLSLLLGFVCAALTSIIFVAFSDFFICLYTTDAAVIALAVVRMRYVTLFESFNVVLEVMSGVMRVFGRPLTPTVICIAGVCVVRVLWVYTVFPKAPSLEFLSAVFPISWAITGIILTAVYFMILPHLKHVGQIEKHA